MVTSAKRETEAWCGTSALPEPSVKRTTACATRRGSPHRLLRVLAVVLLLVRAIQPVAHVAGPAIDHHAGHHYLVREAAADMAIG